MIKFFLDNLVKTVIVLGIVHTLVRVYLFGLTLDLNIFNMFSVLEVDKVFPKLGEGYISFIISWIFVIIIFFGVLILQIYRSRNLTSR